MELLHTLGINWQLLIAQLVNFLILFVVLSYFIYKPFLKVLDDRRARIKKAMDDAKHLEDQKREMEHFKQQQMRKVDQDASVVLQEARTQAESMKRDLLAQAEKEAQNLVARTKAELAEEKNKMMSDLQASLAGVVVQLTEKLLEREFSDADEKRILSGVEKSLPSLLK
jgi:F-type H+-transporting ATPase subunit b